MPSSTRAFATLALIASLGAACGDALSDTLLIEGVEAAGPTASERPVRGSSMATVETRFGAPATRSSAVGKPPITRWEYADFVVFFEYDHVIHSVRR